MRASVNMLGIVMNVSLQSLRPLPLAHPGNHHRIYSNLAVAPDACQDGAIHQDQTSGYFPAGDRTSVFSIYDYAGKIILR